MDPFLKERQMKLYTEFRPPSGWIDRFKKQSGLVYRKVCGEANSVNPEEVVAWKTQLFCISWLSILPRTSSILMNLACSTICCLTKHPQSKKQAAKA
jgi:hypothetical protein